ncbi:MAG: paraslipin [SAR324 cluster bacterium]|nr:paraslipin [SAR324 cluster bacterium]
MELMSVGIFLVILVIILLAKGLLIVKQGEALVIERLGTYHSTLNSGLNVIIPFLDNPRSIIWQRDGKVGVYSRIDIREMVLDVSKQTVITKDNVGLTVDAIMYVQITDAKRAVYEVANLPIAVSQLAQTTLRSVIGELELDETLASRDRINAGLKSVLDEATDKWGVKVSRVEIRDISPPRDVQEAMEKQMQAERQRRARVLEAEGDKQSRIARSEGEKQENINNAVGEREAIIQKADGEAQSIMMVAEAQKQAMQKIVEACQGNVELAVKYMLAQAYISGFQRFTQGDGDKVFIPFEASATLGAMGSIADLFKDKT